MGKLHKTLKRADPLYYADKDIYEETHPLGTQAESAYDATQAAEKALKTAEDTPVVPLPDEEELARVRRRDNARRRSSGRSSTILSDSDALGG